MATNKKQISMMKVFGLSHVHENTSIEFTDDGLRLSSGVNVTSNIAWILTYGHDGEGNRKFEGKVYKGESMQVYRRHRNINGLFVNRNTIINVQKVLLKQARDDIKLAKQWYI